MHSYRQYSLLTDGREAPDVAADIELGTAAVCLADLVVFFVFFIDWLLLYVAYY